MLARLLLKFTKEILKESKVERGGNIQVVVEEEGVKEAKEVIEEIEAGETEVTEVTEATEATEEIVGMVNVEIEGKR